MDNVTPGPDSEKRVMLPLMTKKCVACSNNKTVFNNHKHTLHVCNKQWTDAVTCHSGLAVACLTAVHEVLGSNCAVGSCVYRKNHCDLQPWARGVCTLPAVPRSTQSSTLCGMVNEYQLSGWWWWAMVVVDASCLKQADSQPKSGGLVWGSAATWCCSTFTRWTEWTLAMTSVMMTAL